MNKKQEIEYNNIYSPGKLVQIKLTVCALEFKNKKVQEYNNLLLNIF